MKQVKPETAMKKRMQEYVNRFGLNKNTDTILEDGTRVYIIVPNRFGPGYIYVINHGYRWGADFSTKTPGKLCTPKQVKIQQS